MKTLKEILELSTEYLNKNHCLNPRIEAEWLIGHALALNRMDLYLQFSRPISEEEATKIRPLLKRRTQGEPVQYITGDTEFYGLEMFVGKGVLIPRPETERLVDLALEKIKPGETVLDLCTGTGAIALALGDKLGAESSILGIDISEDALKYARLNKDNLKLNNVRFAQSNLFENIEEQTFSLITANPPYISEKEFKTLHKEITDFEPELALTAEEDGLSIIRTIAESAKDYLKQDAWLICEIGETQAQKVKDIFTENGFADCEIVNDYTGRERIILGRNPSPK